MKDFLGQKPVVHALKALPSHHYQDEHPRDARLVLPSRAQR